SFTVSGTPYTVDVPNACITFDPFLDADMSGSASTVYDGQWETTVPSFGLAGNTFLAGVALQTLPGGFPGGIKNVTWQGTFFADFPGVSLHWQWAAAVYRMFSDDYNSLGVKPVDDNMASIYQNADHAGTPENFKHYVTGGARGGGGSNFTGSLSATQSVTCECPATTTSTFTTSSTSSTQSTSTSSTSSTCEKLSVRAVLDPATGRF